MEKFAAVTLATLLVAGTMPAPVHAANPGGGAPTATPIKHLVVIFQENVSFDHYFGTYPFAANSKGEPAFFAKPGTPTVNNLLGSGLLTSNPNFLNSENGAGATNPFRLDRSQAATADQDHDYTPEQKAFDRGLMDAFPASVGTGDTAAVKNAGTAPAIADTTGLTMGYFDGNTVTAYWNYAQRYAMSDNFYGTNFGPSTDGAVNLISGQLNGVIEDKNPGGSTIEDGNGGLTLISDADPFGDTCSTTTGETVRFGGKNIGDLLNSEGVSWGWFQGGFNLKLTNSNGTTGCKRSTTSAVTGVTEGDYIQHHEPFQYYASTANLTHARPSSVSNIGFTDGANHQYDINDFFDALSAGNLPAVSYLKAPGFEDGHAGYSDPLDEQNFVVTVINALQKSQDWNSTAVIISYDDSDGWYDHQQSPIVNQSATAADIVAGQPSCGTGANALPGALGAQHAQGRCGYGPRLPLLAVSPWSKSNFVDHTIIDQSSILRFVEDNWLHSQRITGSFDVLAGPLDNLFDFTREGDGGTFVLSPSTGLPDQNGRGGNGYGNGGYGNNGNNNDRGW
jgi:phospholipase C